MRWGTPGALIALFVTTATSWPYDPAYIQYNLNQNKHASNPADYSVDWPGHKYVPSPENWRFPVYTLFLDRFVNGDPTNDNVNGTTFEHDLNSNQMRHGGDVAGLIDTLDYVHGMGVKVSALNGVPVESWQHANRDIGYLHCRNAFDEPAVGN